MSLFFPPPIFVLDSSSPLQDLFFPHSYYLCKNTLELGGAVLNRYKTRIKRDVMFITSSAEPTKDLGPRRGSKPWPSTTAVRFSRNI